MKCLCISENPYVTLTLISMHRNYNLIYNFYCGPCVYIIPINNIYFVRINIMNSADMKKIIKTSIATSSVLLMATLSEGLLAGDFAKADYRGDAVFWELSLPKDAREVEVRVVYTPPDVKGDSYLEQVTVKRGSQVVYPFSDKLVDGTYNWELRLVKEGETRGFSPGSRVEEGPIDSNGRQIAIVGKSPSPNGKVRLSNEGRDSVQTGSFTVVRGMIPDFQEQEKD